MKKLLITLISAVFMLGGISGAGDYTAEQQDAYDYAYSQKITTISSIEKANMDGQLTRIAMAKMISNYAINVLGLQPDIYKDCSFSDVPDLLNEKYNYGVIQACQLGLMGIGNDGKKLDRFDPYATVTRAQFATAFSRVLSQSNGKVIENGNPYYSTHLEYLKLKGIIKNTSTPSPSSVEKRGNVMIMMYRTFNFIERELEVLGLEKYGKFSQWEFRPNGKIKKAESYYGSYLTGDYVSFYENGQLKEKGQYKNDKKTGKWTEYFENGDVKSEGTYKDGKLEGYAVRYCEKGKENQGYYKDGKCISWEGNYENGEYVVGGTSVSYYDNGQIQTIVNRNSDAELDGGYTWYYENGQLKEKGQYKNNKKTGEWVEYYENGKTKSIKNYKNGVLDGNEIFYDEDGSVWITHYKDGEIYFDLEKYGEFNKYVWYGSSGKINYAFFEDEDGKWNGDYVSFYENGQLKEKGQYKNNKKTGKWTEYFENGDVKSKGTYKDGELEGYAVRYCEKGKENQGYYRDGECISWEGNYKNGEYIAD